MAFKNFHGWMLKSRRVMGHTALAYSLTPPVTVGVILGTLLSESSHISASSSVKWNKIVPLYAVVLRVTCIKHLE